MKNKSYIEMGEEVREKIEALYYILDKNCKDIEKLIDWPWQSINKHIKIMEDRILNKAVKEKDVLFRAEANVKKYGLVQLVEKKRIDDAEKERIVIEKLSEVTKEQYENMLHSVITPSPENQPNLTDISVITSPYISALLDIVDRHKQGLITFRGMVLDEELGMFRVDFEVAK